MKSHFPHLFTPGQAPIFGGYERPYTRTAVAQHSGGLRRKQRDAPPPSIALCEDCALRAQHFVGHEALDRHAGYLRANHPRSVYTLRSKPQALHNAGRMAWGSGPPGDPPVQTGWDVIVVRDEKIAALYVFLDAMPS